MKKVKVKILQSVAGAGDPSPASLQRKYETMAQTMTQQSVQAQTAGKRGKSAEEIDALVDAERRADAKIPRVAGFDHVFSFKPGDTPLIPADLAAKWQESGICLIEEESGKSKAA
jgi:hypothetical protein